MGFIRNVWEEIHIIRERDPAIHSSMEVFLYPSFKAMLHYRLAHRLYEKKHFFLARYVSQRGARKTGIEIHPGARIGKGLFIDHGNGVVIGETTVIGDNVTLYQGVTLGGTGKEHGKRHPTVGNNVMISAGAKVLGSFPIGDNSKIGAGSVVLSEVPPNSTVVGVPGRVVKRNNRSLPQETMNQVDLPDPVKEDIACLQQANADLANRLLAMEEEVRRIRKEMDGQEGGPAREEGAGEETWRIRKEMDGQEGGPAGGEGAGEETWRIRKEMDGQERGPAGEEGAGEETWRIRKEMDGQEGKPAGKDGTQNAVER